jgi:hypothetical protein
MRVNKTIHRVFHKKILSLPFQLNGISFMAKIRKIAPDYIFESSWEVCNKIGGIYTVLSTRARILQYLWEDKIIFIGPDLGQEASGPDFVEDEALWDEWK